MLNLEQPVNPVRVAWCRKFFAQMADGAQWAMPRSGLLFEKRGIELVLVERAMAIIELKPQFRHAPPQQREALTEKAKQHVQHLQDADFADTKRHFAAAGISVKDATRTLH